MKLIHILCVIFILVASQVNAQVPEEPHVAVNGTHEISVVPDILEMSLNITKVDQEVAQARSIVEKNSAQLIKALSSLGVANKDINSAELKITPHYNWNNRSQVYTGTEVSRTIKLVLRDLNKYDLLVRSIIDANVARINNTTLKSTKEKELQAKALQGAVNNAREKAQLLVTDFPEKIGSLYSISDSSARVGVVRSQYRMAELSTQNSFEPGVIIVTKSVQVVFYLSK